MTAMLLLLPAAVAARSCASLLVATLGTANVVVLLAFAVFVVCMGVTWPRDEWTRPRRA